MTGNKRPEVGLQDENLDAFGNDISNRTNVLDLAAHYPYSPERWRLFVGGTRQFPEYGSVTQYNHAGGWQVGYDSLFTAQGNNTADQAAGNIASKRPIYPQDAIVFIANAGGTGDVSVNYRTEQDW